MNLKLKEKIRESLAAVLPITAIVLLISIFIVPMEIGTVTMFLTGAVMLVIGMGFFQLGAEMAMTPLGEGIGIQLSRGKKILPILLVTFAMGIIITVAEPDLQVLANQVPAIPNLTLILAVAIGVGLFLAAAVLRIILHIDLSRLLMVFYLLLIGVSFFVPDEFLSVAFDSGGVTTGPITVPFIMALGVGISAMRNDKHSTDDSFGLVALSSIGPILAVLILGCFYNPKEAVYTAGEILSVATTRDVAQVFAAQIPKYAEEVAVSIFPILAVFLIFQLISRRYTRHQQMRSLMGFIYTYLGLVLFLCGVNVGFSPVGTIIGEKLNATAYNWILVPIGMLIGYYIVKAEPAIQILNRQIHSVTNGMVSEKAMNRCLSIGVSVSVGISMLRILAEIPLYWIIIPGYVIALVMSRFTPRIFVGIAFDSGGVASGPMTTTFLLPMAIGACRAIGGNIMTDAFGVVALVALTPLIAIQAMGIHYSCKLHKASLTAAPDMPDSDEIIELEDEFDGQQ